VERGIVALQKEMGTVALQKEREMEATKKKGGWKPQRGEGRGNGSYKREMALAEF